MGMRQSIWCGFQSWLEFRREVTGNQEDVRPAMPGADMTQVIPPQKYSRREALDGRHGWCGLLERDHLSQMLIDHEFTLLVDHLS